MKIILIASVALNVVVIAGLALFLATNRDAERVTAYQQLVDAYQDEVERLGDRVNTLSAQRDALLEGVGISKQLQILEMDDNAPTEDLDTPAQVDGDH